MQQAKISAPQLKAKFGSSWLRDHKICLLLLTLVLCSVGCGHRVMTSDRFSEVAIGTSVETLEKNYGAPYSIRRVDNERSVYEYMERINLGTQTIEMRSYYFVITNGLVTGKYMRYSNPPPYESIYSDEIYPNG